MALSKLLLLFLLLASVAALCMVEAQVEDTGLGLISEAMEWPSSFPFALQEEAEEEFYGEGIGADEDSKDTRRSLFWHRIHYYISYAALSANRVPCPPRSGRSYYTHNCYRARGPVHPYSRNCETITRCRR